MLIVEASQAGLRSHENDIDREESQLLPTLIRMLEEDGVTLQQVADELAIPAHELRDLMFLPSVVVDVPPSLRLLRGDS